MFLAHSRFMVIYAFRLLHALPYYGDYQIKIVDRKIILGKETTPRIDGIIVFLAKKM